MPEFQCFNFMRYFLTLFIFIVLSVAVFAQKPAKKPTPTETKPVAVQMDEKQEFQKARSQPILDERIDALKKFVSEFPKSESNNFALELIASTRAELGDQKLRLSDNQAGIDLFNLAVIEAPTPISDKLFSMVLVQLPTNLYYQNQRRAADDIAELIEARIAGNPKQLLSLAAYYLGTENGAEAKRIAESVIELEPDSASAYQSLGFANRLNFDLTASAEAYKKALSLNPESVISKRNLAEMLRATGKSEDALKLFREVLAANPLDQAAENGVVLSLFDSGKTTEAEAAMETALAASPNNFFLLAGAAYWYAGHQQGAKAIELSERALSIEPRYSWTYIAMARGLVQQKRPLEAERILLAARQFSNFPTINYELASARMAAGLYREAGDELRKSFEVKDGVISVNLGGRVLKKGDSFIEILSHERLASIFEPVAADDPITAERLKTLLNFSQNLESSEPNTTAILKATDEFIAGNDNMKIHRMLFAANRLLEKKTAPEKALELVGSATSKVETSLDVVNPSSTIMADILYETRTIAALRNELLLVPDIPRPTLTKIVRGRIEELAGWALLQQQKTEEATARFQSAINILPEKSAWWRSSQWHLGDALSQSGDSAGALNAYLEGYNTDIPDSAKRLLIELVYEKVHGSTDGLEKLIGAKAIRNETKPAQSEKPGDVLSADTETTIQDSDQKPTPDAVKFAENVPISLPKPDASPNELEKPKTATENTTTQTTEKTASTEQKVAPLFESIIINVPRSGRQEKPKEVDPKPDPEVSETVKTEVVAAEPEIGIEPKLDETDSENDNAAKSEQVESVPRTVSRPRVVSGSVSDNSASSNVNECKLKIANETISLLNDGGSLGMFVGFDGNGGDATKIRAVSESPNDVDVILQPDINVLSERAFFIFKSISTKVGTYNVSFDSNCGKKIVVVNVR